MELVSAATSAAAAVVVEEEAVSAAAKLSLASAVEVLLPLLFIVMRNEQLLMEQFVKV